MKAFVAMTDGLADQIFPTELAGRLGRTVNIVSDVDQAELLISGWGAPVLDAAYLVGSTNLRAVFHTGGSIKHHVTQAVFDRGIVVSSAARANARPVAEFTVAALVLAAKRSFALSRGASSPFGPYGLYGTAVGIIGASQVGRGVLELLGGYNVRVLLSDPYVSPSDASRLGAELVGLDRLCAESAIVSLHAPDLPETYHMLDGRRLALMRDGAIVVNTARGRLLDHTALTAECASGRLDAVLDVTDPDPLPPEHPLRDLPNVFVTPHIAGSQGRELARLGEFALAEIIRYVNGEPLLGQVRPADLARIA